MSDPERPSGRRASGGGGRANRLRPSLNWLAALVPLVVLLEVVWPERAAVLFLTAAAAIIPFAAWIGRATEQLAERAGDGVGGLVNATFGNAAELIIGIAALRRGLVPVVKASITGAILSNVLLVLGAAVLAAGLRRGSVPFNAVAARAQASMLTLAAISLLAPAVLHSLGTPATGGDGVKLALVMSPVLLLTYACGVVFSLKGAPSAAPAEPAGEPRPPVRRRRPGRPWGLGRTFGVLAGATAVTAWLSEVLVGAIEPAARAMGVGQVFIGVVVVALIGNAAEHATAVAVARHLRMDLAFGIALGSSVQIALFVAPVLVLLSHLVGPRRMDFAFSTPEVMAVAASVLISGQVAGDGQCNWLEGVQLLAAYVVLALVFFFLPG